MVCATPSADDMDWHRLHRRAGRCQSTCTGRDCAAQSIHWVRCGDGIVYLDLREDSYSCEYSPLEDNDETGSVAGEPDSGVGETAAQMPPGPAGIEPATPLSLVDIVYFIRAVGRTSLRFPGRRLSALVAHATRSSPRSEGQGIEHAFVYAAKFRRMCLFLPFRPACLFGSYLMLEYLHLRGIGADWVFGVQLFPFRAHCWLAADARPLNDRPDNIAFYSPILIVSGSGS